MINEQQLRQLLRKVHDGSTPIDEAVGRLRQMPFEEVGGVACLDHHRAVRRGQPEVIFGQGKRPEHLAQIFERLATRQERVLATRCNGQQFDAIRKVAPAAHYDELSRAVVLDRAPDRPRLAGVVVAAAGTSDLAVAEEAAITLAVLGHAPRRVYDVGVAGLHRLLAHVEDFQNANAIVAVAGMEGAMPSVICGLCAAPVIAVPTSVGYGAAFDGLAALLGMLNSCATGVGVVNIDNGFGAGSMAATINQQARAAAADAVGA